MMSAAENEQIHCFFANNTIADLALSQKTLIFSLWGFAEDGQDNVKICS
jgi:hypothetical protein